MNPAMEVKDPIFLDVELRGFPKGHTREAFRKCGMAVAVTWRKKSGGYRTYFARDCKRLAQDLHEADCVVGYNCRAFDYEVIRGYVEFASPHTCDLMEVIAASVGHRISLGSIIDPTFGMRYKDKFFMEYPTLWTNGRKGKIVWACKRDVLAMRRLYKQILEEGWIKYLNRWGCVTSQVSMVYPDKLPHPQSK